VEARRVVRQNDRLTDDGEVVSFKHRPAITLPGRHGNHFCQKLKQPQAHSTSRCVKRDEKSMISSGTEHATFQPIAHCLNQLCHRVPNIMRFIMYTFVVPTRCVRSLNDSTLPFLSYAINSVALSGSSPQANYTDRSACADR
jgi:hypothetical protein